MNIVLNLEESERKRLCQFLAEQVAEMDDEMNELRESDLTDPQQKILVELFADRKVVKKVLEVLE